MLIHDLIRGEELVAYSNTWCIPAYIPIFLSDGFNALLELSIRGAKSFSLSRCFFVIMPLLSLELVAAKRYLVWRLWRCRALITRTSIWGVDTTPLHFILQSKCQHIIWDCSSITSSWKHHSLSLVYNVLRIDDIITEQTIIIWNQTVINIAINNIIKF